MKLSFLTLTTRILLFTSLVILTGFAHAQSWVPHQLVPTDDVNLSCIASSADGTKLVVGTGLVDVNPLCYIYTSADSGVTWQSSPASANSNNWTTVVSSADGTRLAANGGGVIYVSSDSGKTWTQSVLPTVHGQNFSIPTPVGGLASSADGMKLVTLGGCLACDQPDGIYHSSDGGATWSAVFLPDATNEWSVVVSSADGMYLAAAGVSESTQAPVIYLSTDSGVSWHPSSAPSQNWTALASSADGSKLAAVSSFPNSIFTSADYGATWNIQLGAPSQIWDAVVSSADGTRLAAGAFYNRGGIYTSTDSGATWSSPNTPTATVGTNTVQQGWEGLACSSNGLKLAALSGFDGEVYTVTLSDLDATMSATPQRLQTGGRISVVVTVENATTNTMSGVHLAGGMVAAGTGGVSLVGDFSTGASATLLPHQTVNFTNIYQATNNGRLTFSADVQGMESSVGPVSFTCSSSEVLIVPNGDLLVKRAQDPPDGYAGLGVFQKVPIPPQVVTNFVNTAQVSQFQVLIENNDPQAQNFTLQAQVLGNLVWKENFVFPGDDETTALQAPGGITLPLLDPGSSLMLNLSVQDTNGTTGDINGVVITLGLASDPTVTLDAVAVVSRLVPIGDLLIKRDADSANFYAGQDIFQTVPAYPQIETNIVAFNQDSKFQVQIQNTSTQAQTFTMVAKPLGNGGWKRTYLLGALDMTSQLEAPGGASLPELAPSNSLTLNLIVRATNAPPGDVQRIDFSLVSASDATLTLDAVEAVSQLGAPDLAVVSMAWDYTNSGLDFVYTNRGSALTNDTLAEVFWASGPTTNDIIANLPPIYTVHIPAGFSDQASNQATEVHFDYPPPNATHVQLVLDPDNLVIESTKTNNVLALPLTFRHVVLVMMENRSFDHFLGWLPGADGRLSGTYTNAAGQAWTNYHLTYFQGCGCDDPDHSYLGARIALNPTTSACDGWLLANPKDTYSIGYYLPGDLAFFSQIAPNWTVCDRYFAAIMAETQPNRIYQHAAQTDCLTNRTTFLLALPTIWDSLNSGNVSARYYYDGETFQQTPLFLWGFKYQSLEYRTSQFYSDCASGSLPSVSFVDPELTSATVFAVAQDNGLAPAGVDTGGNDDHPHADIRNGEAFLSRVYNAIVSSPQWSSTVFIINFDEWGGFYDHVVPPVVPSEQVPGADSLAYSGAGLFPLDPTYGSRGFRVPCIVISPWSHTNAVNHDTFDHTSVLKLIEDRWNVANLTARDLNAEDLTNVMDFAHPDYSAPPVLQNVPSGSPYGGFCQSIQIARQPDGTLAAVWDSTCLKVILQTAPTLFGPWTDQPNILTPPYVLNQTAGLGTFLIRFKVLGSGYVTPPL